NNASSYGKGVQVHIPNNGGCTFSDQSITLPYGDISTSASSSGSNTTATTTTTTTASSGTSAASAVKVTTVMTFGAALLTSMVTLL
ncbi:hypothetical protein PF005_g27943, partial [Phytophthora fragariae]